MTSAGSPIAIDVTSLPLMPGFVDYVVEAERMGARAVWVPEAWGTDALTPLGALASRTDHIRLGTGIVQLGARTPAMLAMSAASLQLLSGGRLLLGLGTSGPQVMEGWHGVPFERPLQRTRETIEILRKIVAGDRLEYDGALHHLPLPGGQGRALRLGAPLDELPIYVASLGPNNLRLTGELTDGWLGTTFLCGAGDVFLDPIAEGAEAAGRTLDEVDLTVSVTCEITDDVDEAARRHAAGYAFTIGAMGSASTNFYNAAFSRQGFGEEVAEVQRLWRSGDREAAAAAVPMEIGRGTNLLGPPEEIARRLREYAEAGIDGLRVVPGGETLDERLACLGELFDIVASLDA
ncbi:MAG: LLM class flavin-dependent oxidoreductase [Actinomycetota bacterium]